MVVNVFRNFKHNWPFFRNNVIHFDFGYKLSHNGFLPKNRVCINLLQLPSTRIDNKSKFKLKKVVNKSYLKNASDASPTRGCESYFRISV